MTDDVSLIFYQNVKFVYPAARDAQQHSANIRMFKNRLLSIQKFNFAIDIYLFTLICHRFPYIFHKLDLVGVCTSVKAAG